LVRSTVDAAPYTSPPKGLRLAIPA
jgi:hypothetical protein